MIGFRVTRRSENKITVRILTVVSWRGRPLRPRLERDGTQSRSRGASKAKRMVAQREPALTLRGFGFVFAALRCSRTLVRAGADRLRVMRRSENKTHSQNSDCSFVAVGGTDASFGRDSNATALRSRSRGASEAKRLPAPMRPRRGAVRDEGRAGAEGSEHARPPSGRTPHAYRSLRVSRSRSTEERAKRRDCPRPCVRDVEPSTTEGGIRTGLDKIKNAEPSRPARDAHAH